MKCPTNIFLMIAIFIVSTSPCVCSAQTVITSEPIHPKDRYEGLTDFIDGRLESIHKNVWNVEGTDFLVPEDVGFFDMNGEEISRDSISVGNMIRITYASDNDDRVIEVELQEKGGDFHERTAKVRHNDPKRHQVIVLKNGVYTNEPH